MPTCLSSLGVQWVITFTPRYADMDEEKAFKKFFLQRSVLDMLRVYIDVSEEFLAKMEEQELLNEDDLVVVKGLRWPSNRNELLQILIKKPWKQRTFDSFCVVLRETQPENLTKMVVEKASDFVTNQLESAKISLGVDLEIDLAGGNGANGINIQAQNAVRILIRDRDEEIQRLKNEVDDLHANLKSIVGERNHLKEEFTQLDTLVMNWFAAMHLSGSHEVVSESLEEIKNKILNQESNISTLEAEKKSLEVTVEELRAKLALVTDESIKLREANKQLTERTQTIQKISDKRIADLEEEINKLKETNTNQTDKMNMHESRSLESSRITDVEITGLRVRLSDVSRQLGIVTKERDDVRHELEEISEKARKLLFTLDLSNQAETLGLSLDHARNVSYMKRRRSSSQPMTSPIVDTSGTSSSGGNGSSVNSGSVLPKRLGRVSETPLGSSMESVTPLTNGLRRPSLQGTTPRGAAAVNPLDRQEEGLYKCLKCGKIYQDASNFDGACVFHVDGAIKMNEGTELEVWSCCRSVNTIRGCQKARHLPGINGTE